MTIQTTTKTATMDTRELYEALKKATPLKINRQLINGIPILSNTLAEFADGKGTLTTSDLERGIKVGFECTSDEPFSVMLPLRTAERFLHGSNGKTTLKVGKSLKQLTIERENMGQIDLKELPLPSDFPLVPWADNLIWSKLDAKWFCRMMGIIVTSCATEESRPILKGIHCKDGAIASTDGFRLTVLKDERLAFGLGDKEMVIPATTTNLVRRLFSKEENLEIAFEIDKSGFGGKESVNRVYFRSGDVSMVSQVIQGSFPQYNQLIPNSFSCKVSFSAPVMAQRLGMIDEKNLSDGIVRFNFIENDKGEQLCSITGGYDNELGKYSLTLPVKIESKEEGKIAFNIKYITTPLKFFSLVDLEITSVSSPGKFTGDIEGLTVAVMPMFVEW